MDDLITLAIILVAVLVGGALAGIVALVRIGGVRSELQALRTRLDRLESGAPAMDADFSPRTRFDDVPRPTPDIPVLPWGTAPPAPPEPRSPEPRSPQPDFPPPEPTPPPPPKPRRDLEELLALRWGVWLGAAALLLSGVFLVRYAVEQGLLGPAVRVGLMVLLAAALVGAAEWLRRRPAFGGPAFDRPALDRPALSRLPDQTPAALAAGGAGILFGAAYAAAVLYALVPPLAGFVLMAAAALAALLLSLRMGPLVAAIGIVGAFGTPALVQTDAPSLPGLFLYLLFVAAAALAVMRYTAWTWMGAATTLACALWVIVSAGIGPGADIWAPALFVPAAALLNLALLPPAALDQPIGRSLAWLPLAVLGLAGLVLLAITADPWARAGVLLLSPIAIARAATEPRLDRLPWLGAAFALLVLMAWGLPEWHPTGEAISIEQVVQATLPGNWVPDALRPLLGTAALMALLHAAAGLWFETRRPHAVRWAALPAAVPVTILAVLFAKVELFQPQIAWAGVALLLAAGLVGATARARSAGARQRAGVHAAGVIACLALGFAMLLRDEWLTLAVALLLPGLAWVEAEADLPPLRQVALGLAGLVLVRLLLNWYVLDYADGQPPVLNALLPAYLGPAIAFAWAARLFRRRADDRLVTVLEAGALAFTTVLIALEIRQWAATGPADRGFLEAGLHVAALAIQSVGALAWAQRRPRPTLHWAARLQGGLALLGGSALILANPMVVDTGPVGTWPVLNALLLAYAVPALAAAIAVWRLERRNTLVGAYALAAALAWITLEVRHAFHPDSLALDAAPVEAAELWAWSGAWLVFGLIAMAAGIRLHLKALRLTALAVVALVAAKAFLIDMAGLVGLWRVLSFLGLGLALIGLGAIYRRFVAPADPAGPDPT